MRYFASIGTDLICNGVQNSEGDVIADNVIEITTQVESGTALEDFTWRKYENGAWSVEKYTVPATDPLDLSKKLKKDSLLIARNNALESFISSALGTPHTYLSRAASVPNDMLLLTSEYSFVTGTNFDNQSVPWYNEEEGNVMHTGAQMVQVYLDARANVQAQMLHCGTLNAQVDACATIDAVNAIVW